MVNIVASDDLTTQGAKASSNMILTLLNRNNLVPIRCQPQPPPTILGGHGNHFFVSETSDSNSEKLMKMFPVVALFS